MSVVVPAGNLNLSVILRILLENVLPEDDLHKKLVESLKLAKKNAIEKLKPGIYEYFNVAYGYCGWPTNVVTYMDYVRKYMTQVPFAQLPKNEFMEKLMAKSPEWVMKHPLIHHYGMYQQCVYYEICQFYWLINQTLRDGTTLQSNPLFASWVKMFGVGQGIFLNTPESLTPETLQTFIDDPRYHMNWYLDNKDDWKCWNQFFCRQFNGADPITGLSSLRPIDPDPNTIVSPADCTYQAVYSIDNEGNLMDLTGNPASYKLKNFSYGTSVQHLLGVNCMPFWKDYFGGTFIHYFLSPYDYHRFHTPVAGLVTAVETINGQNYLAVDITDKGEFDAPDSAADGYEFRQERGLVIVDNDDLGRVACLPIGMAQVSSVHMYKDRLLYREVIKGQEFGYFLFGGSDIILLVPKPVDQLDIQKEGFASRAKHFKYGEASIVCKPSAQ